MRSIRSFPKSAQPAFFVLVFSPEEIVHVREPSQEGGASMPKTVHIRLRDILRERRMTRQQLAQLTGLRPSTISDLCKPSVSRIYLSTIAALCATLDISVGELIAVEFAERC